MIPPSKKFLYLWPKYIRRFSLKPWALLRDQYATIIWPRTHKKLGLRGGTWPFWNFELRHRADFRKVHKENFGNFPPRKKLSGRKFPKFKKFPKRTYKTLHRKKKLDRKLPKFPNGNFGTFRRRKFSSIWELFKVPKVPFWNFWRKWNVGIKCWT